MLISSLIEGVRGFIAFFILLIVKGQHGPHILGWVCAQLSLGRTMKKEGGNQGRYLPRTNHVTSLLLVVHCFTETSRHRPFG